MIKSQDELNTCNEGKRGSEVLLATIERCEALEKENENLRQLLKECLVYIPYSYPQFQTEKRIDLDSAKLDILTRINTVIGESEE